jgi:hypothetical protein
MLSPLSENPGFIIIQNKWINYTYAIQSLFNESTREWLLYTELRLSLNGRYAKLHPDTAHVLIKPNNKIIPLCEQLKKLCLHK